MKSNAMMVLPHLIDFANLGINLTIVSRCACHLATLIALLLLFYF